MPLISVIIPTYNRVQVLPKAIKSVLEQSFENWELIVVDDGSEDGTEDVVLSFLDDKRIVYKYQINTGVSAARNLGASIAKGKYLVFLDSDDNFLNHALEAFQSKIQESPDLIFAKYLVKGKKKGLNINPNFYGHFKVSNISGSFCFEKSYFHKVGEYQMGATNSENWELVIRAINFSKNVRVLQIDRPVLIYNVWKSSEKLVQYKKNKIDSYLIFYQNYFNNNNFNHYFAHVLANNYAGLGQFKSMIKWIFLSLKLKRKMIYFIKPVGIFIKRKIIKY